MNSDPRSYKTIQITGPDGQFEIAFCGASPEGPRYLYKDPTCTHFFYVDPYMPRVTVLSEYSPSASVLFSTNAEDEARIRRNIEFFFKTRNPISPEKEANAGQVDTVFFGNE
jgi:hypothetical protein